MSPVSQFRSLILVFSKQCVEGRRDKKKGRKVEKAF
jgi:hypothetical protein